MIWAIDDFFWLALKKKKRETVDLSSYCYRRNAHQFHLHLKSSLIRSFPSSLPLQLDALTQHSCTPISFSNCIWLVRGAWYQDLWDAGNLPLHGNRTILQERNACPDTNLPVCGYKETVFSGKRVDSTWGTILQKTLLFCASPRWNILLWRVEVLQIISRSHWNRFKYYLSHENKLMQCPNLRFRTQEKISP